MCGGIGGEGEGPLVEKIKYVWKKGKALIQVLYGVIIPLVVLVQVVLVVMVVLMVMMENVFRAANTNGKTTRPHASQYNNLASPSPHTLL